jgi:hypothetical protein
MNEALILKRIISKSFKNRQVVTTVKELWKRIVQNRGSLTCSDEEPDRRSIGPTKVDGDGQLCETIKEITNDKMRHGAVPTRSSGGLVTSTLADFKCIYKRFQLTRLFPQAVFLLRLILYEKFD